jgi:hypothetical protein
MAAAMLTYTERGTWLMSVNVGNLIAGIRVEYDALAVLVAHHAIPGAEPVMQAWACAAQAEPGKAIDLASITKIT